MTVYVREGDILEVDGTRYKRPLEIEIFDVSGDVLSPAVDTTIRVEGNIYSLDQCICQNAGIEAVHLINGVLII